MKSKITAFILSVLTCLSTLFAGCSFGYKPGETAKLKANENYKIVASATDDNINLSISTKEKEENTTYDVVKLKQYEYIKGETDIGVNYYNKDNFVYSTGQKVGEYVSGEKTTISLDRYKASEGTIETDQTIASANYDYDDLYSKFVLAKDGKLVAGPFMVSEIDSQRDYEQKTEALNKKGLICEIQDTVVESGSSWTEMNVLVNEVVFPNELVNEQTGEVTPVDNSGREAEGNYRFFSNGKVYYMRKSYVDQIDNHLLFCKENNIKSILILWCQKNYDQSHCPYFLTYPMARDFAGAHIWAVDTSSEIGAGYYTAVMEFLAERYSREDGLYGWVHRFVVGNEVDISTEWHPLANYNTTESLPLSQYVEEYLRQLRLAEQATKKYYKDNMVLVSTCHYWAGSKAERGRYASKSIYDYINQKATYQGNFNWGMAAHPYPVDLSDSFYYLNETSLKDKSLVSGDFNTSTYITWTNFEILDLYLAQEALLFNGQMRRVYSTEGGVSSGIYEINREINEKRQAAGVAYAYYKSMSMECIDALVYYRTYDAAGDGSGCNFGLFDSSHNAKPSWEVYKNIDTERSFEIANLYLSDMRYRKNDVLYGNNKNPITSYKQAMKLVDSDFDWETAWSEDKIITRRLNSAD